MRWVWKLWCLWLETQRLWRIACSGGMGGVISERAGLLRDPGSYLWYPIIQTGNRWTTGTEPLYQLRRRTIYHFVFRLDPFKRCSPAVWYVTLSSASSYLEWIMGTTSTASCSWAGNLVFYGNGIDVLLERCKKRGNSPIPSLKEFILMG